jgi:CPA2 family monovalent cation:H+ antiporter-2
MEGAHGFLTNLALVLCVAGITTLIFQRLHQPVVFGYLLAGLIIGPHTSIPLVADEETVQTLAELGVILLMFSLGLELSLRKLLKVGPIAGAIAVGQCSLLLWIGYLTGRAFGWTQIESIYAGGIIAISSTTIIIKAFAEQGVRERFTRLVFGILIVEDLIAIFLLTVLTTIAGGGSVSAGTMITTAGRLVIFLSALIGAGLLVVPRLVRMLVRLNRPETTLVTSIGLCFAFALLAINFGYSVALGAFIAGSLLAESGHGHEIEQLVQPVRDMFGAIFFVAVGMLIDPRLIVEHVVPVIVMTLVVIIGKVGSVSIMGFLTGNSIRTSVQTGMSLAQIGEFSFIIAGLGLTLGATRDFLYPIAVAVSAVTTLSTPWLIRASGPTASWIDRKLPRPLQTFIALYGSWLEQMREGSRRTKSPRSLRRPVLFLTLDALLLAGVVIATGLELDRISPIVAGMVKVTPEAAHITLIGVAVLVAAPLWVGILRVSGFLSAELALRAFPNAAAGKVDFASAPRRALSVTVQIVIVLLVGAPIIAVTQAFLPMFPGTVLLLIILGVLAIAFWRSATNLHGHARAGAEIIAMALSRQMADEEHPAEDEEELARVRAALPGLGDPVPVKLTPGSAAIDRTLAQINLRANSGATVLAILRNGQDVILPTGREALKAGDVLFLAGSHRAVVSARTRLLRDADAGDGTD